MSVFGMKSKDIEFGIIFFVIGLGNFFYFGRIPILNIKFIEK